MTGRVVTFYSYKGGVGRSFALTNVAVALAKWGQRVLCVDWDLEAPGLDRYLGPLDEPVSGGLIDVFDVEGPSWLDWSPLVVTPPIAELEGRLDLLAAGTDVDGAYAHRTQQIDWDTLYRKRDLGQHVERIRDEWASEYDTVLVDSRTGLTDIGGICTAQLPDILVFAFTANHQSLDGVIDAVRKAEAARDRLPFDRSRMLTVPLPSRFDGREEYKRAEEWRQRFGDLLGEFYGAWVPDRVDHRQVLDLTTIPYLSYWSFGEGVPVLSEKTSSPDYISYNFETLAALIAHDLDSVELLVESRDSYVDQARQPTRTSFGHDIFLSYAARSARVAEAVSAALDERGFQVAGENVIDDGLIGAATEMSLSGSQFLVVVVDDNWRSSRFSQTLLERFIRLSSDTSSQRAIIPVLTDDGPLPPSVRQYQLVDARDASPDQIADLVADAVARIRGPSQTPRPKRGESSDVGPELGDNAGVIVNLAKIVQDRGELAEAEALYRRAAELGDATGMLGLGLLELDRGKFDTAEQHLLAAAGLGQVDAMAQLGALCERVGRPAEAQRWYLKAINLGSVDAMIRLAILYEEQDSLGDAKDLYRRASSVGSTEAMTRLGSLLEEEDTEEAEYLFRAAAEAGNTDAMTKLGQLSEDRGEPDALDWYERAALEGNSTAAAKVGALLHQAGRSTEAEFWLRSALGRHDSDHSEMLARLRSLRSEVDSSRLTQDEYDLAKRRMFDP